MLKDEDLSHLKSRFFEGFWRAKLKHLNHWMASGSADIAG